MFLLITVLTGASGVPPPAGGRSSPARSRPSSREEGPLTPANFEAKYLEFRFRFREWTQIFLAPSLPPSPPPLPTSQPSSIPNLSTWTLRGEPSRILVLSRRWLPRLRSPRPLRNLRHPSPRPPGRRTTPSWENLVEL